MVLLDTNVLSEFMRSQPDPRVIRWVDEQPVSTLYICAITRAEIELGLALLPEGKRKEQLMVQSGLMLDRFSDRCLSFGIRAAAQYGKLVAERQQLGRPIAVEDAQIASIALVNGLRLATRNTKDFESISNLTLIDPWR